MLSNAFEKSIAKTRTNGFVDSMVHTVCKRAISAAVVDPRRDATLFDLVIIFEFNGKDIAHRDEVCYLYDWFVVLKCYAVK